MAFHVQGRISDAEVTAFASSWVFDRLAKFNVDRVATIYRGDLRNSLYDSTESWIRIFKRMPLINPLVT
jgi:hypothetical protein